MLKKVERAIISVSDKSNLEKLLKTLKKFKIEILSSGGTFKAIKKLKFNCQEISSFTGFNEMLDGRVKTLHPKIHAGILHDRKNTKHKKEMRENNYDPIDLIIVNFYPFEENLNVTKNIKKIIENIDIGGPSMVRGAAKNYENTTIVTSTKDYENLINELKINKGKTSLAFREKMASKAFGVTAFYDSKIYDWFNDKTNNKFPELKVISGKRFEKLRYGENPHQQSAIYVNDTIGKGIGLEKLNGKNLSYNNYNDTFAAIEILKSTKKKYLTVIIKHANPCGVAFNKSSLKSFQNALKSDPVSAFGGIVACNYKINSKIALEMNKTFFEVIAAYGFDNSALKILKKKKNLRIIDLSSFDNKNNQAYKFFDNSFLLQEKDETIFDKKKLKCVTKDTLSNKELLEIEFAFRVCKFVKSNAIVLVKDFATLGIGAGQQNRLDSCKIAIQKAKKFHPTKIKSCIAASDAFFPFADGLKSLINAGVKIVVQPGGSIRDKEVINEARKRKIKMIFTGTRHFNH